MKETIMKFLGLVALCGVGLSATAGEQELPEGTTMVSEGFYQSAATYAASTDFYITSKAGLKYFADVVNTIQRDEGTVAYDYRVNFGGPDSTSNPFSGKTVHLLADVDLGNEPWDPIGWDGQDYRGFSSKGVLFHGTFDGGNHTISNLKVVNDAISTSKGKSFAAGLFGKMTAAIEVRDLVIFNVDIGNKEFYSGALAGYTGAGTVSNVAVRGSISINGASFVGGLIGYCTSRIVDSSVEMTGGAGLKASGHVGGVVAYAASNVAIDGCAVSGVKAESTYAGVWYAIGGLVGYYADGIAISDCKVENAVIKTGDATKQNAGSVLGGNNGTNAKMDIVSDVVVSETTVNQEVAAKFGSSNAEGPVIIGAQIAFDEQKASVVGGTFDNIPDRFVNADYMKKALGTTPETWEVVPKPPVAKIGETGYLTFEAAVKAAVDGDVIELLDDVEWDCADIVNTSGFKVTSAGEERKKLTVRSSMLLYGDRLTFDNVAIHTPKSITALQFVNQNSGRSMSSLEILNCKFTGSGNFINMRIAGKTTIRNCEFVGGYRQIYGYPSDGTLIENCKLSGGIYGINFDDASNDGPGDVTVVGCEIAAWNSYSGIRSMTFDGCKFRTGAYNCVPAYLDTTFTGCEFDGDFECYAQTTGFRWTFAGCQMDGVAFTESVMKANFEDSDVWQKCLAVIDGDRIRHDTESLAVRYVVDPTDWLAEGYAAKQVSGGKWMVFRPSDCQAKIVDGDGNVSFYETFADAVNAAAANGTVCVNREIAAGESVVIANKNVALDLAGQVVNADITFAGTAEGSIVDSVGAGRVSGQIIVKENANVVIFAGTFDNDPSAHVAEGLVARADDPTVGPWTVGKPVTKAEEIKPEAVVVDEAAMAEIPEDKVAEAQQAVEELKQKVEESFKTDPVVAATQTHAAEIVKDNPSKMAQAVFAAATAQGQPLTEEEKQQVVENIAKFAQGKADSDTTEYLKIETKTIAAKPVVVPTADTVKVTAQADKLIYEVEPVFETVTVKTDAEGKVSVSKSIPVVMSNEDVEKNPVTFNLEVFNPKATQALVFHHSEDPKYPDETFACPIWELGDKRYITITTSHFSLFEITYSEAVYKESEDAVGILKIEKDGTDVVAAAVPFKAESFDALVTTGAQAGDTVAGASKELGAPFWYARTSDNGVPLTFAGLVDAIPPKAVAAGTAEAPVATLLVNPNRTAANLLAELSGTVAVGDEIALAGDDARYVFDGENWTLVTKGNKSDETDEAVYGDDTVTPVTSVLVDGSRAAWYVSKGGSPTVTWSDGGVGAEFVNGAEGAMTYAAADWTYEKTPFENDTFNHAYVRFACDAGDITFGGDKTGNKTTFLGADGFDWTSFDPSASEFRVALLNGNRDVIAVSRTMTFDDLKAAKALDLNYTGNVAPVAATAKATFGGFTVPDAGEYDALTNAFEGVATVSVDRDANGNFIYTVKLSSDVTGPVALADNLGQVVLDLNGHSISGTVATVDADAGNAIVIGGSLAGAAIPTALLVKNTSVVGAAIVGGNGADGVSPKPGATAIVINSEKEVTVSDPNELVSAGANGVSATAWAWCTCATAPADLPYGVSYEESTGKYLFWRNNGGKAVFDFGEVRDWDITDRKIYFYSQIGGTDVELLYVPATAGNLTFVGEDGAMLVGTGVERAFVVSAGEAQVVAWTNLTFSGAGIEMTHGSFDIQGCAFNGCLAGQFGGAVDAQLIDGDSTIADSVFLHNGFGAASQNGDGGAVFATASAAGTRLVISGTEFTENCAANGGAISTQTRGVAGGKPVALVVADSTFTGNAAATGCSGGAIAAGGDVFVDADATVMEPGTTVFQGNFAGMSGGAIELGYSAPEEAVSAKLSVGRGVQFVGNVVSNDAFFALGGAICVEEPPMGCSYGVAATGVLFRGNSAVSLGTEEGCVADGGAIMTWGDAEVSVDTCVFDGNVASGKVNGDDVLMCSGGALMLTMSAAEIRNSTFRNSNIEAIYAEGGTVGMTNCVAVGNNLDAIEGFGDVAFFPDSAEGYVVAYSAYGSVVGDFTDGGHCLADRTTAIYDGESLKLNPVGFNPVAALGIEQLGAQDFEGVAYGLDGCWSMGAYEALTVKLTVTVTGDKDYDGKVSTNGIGQFAFVLSTNGVAVAAADVCPDLGDVTALFTVTNWTFDAAHVGYYASTNAPGAQITASMSGLDDRRDAFEFVYEGTISPAEDGLEIVIEPLEYEWTGDEVVPTSVTVKDHFTGDTLAEGVDYVLTVSDNVDPTASAKVKAEGLYNFRGASSTSNFWITAYYVKHSFDGEVRDEYTEMYGALSESNAVAQALTEIPEGYCFDWQNSVTNGLVRKFDDVNGLLTIELQYRTDSNGDKVPDGFQKRISAMVVNGEWNDAALSGVNQDVWVTLLNADGKWDYAGAGTFVSDGYADHSLPAAGGRPDGKSQSQGGWIAWDGTKFAVVGDVSAVEINAGTLPVFLYGYLAKKAPGRGSKTPTLDDLAAQYGLNATIEGFSVDADYVTLGARVRLVKQGAAMAEIPLDGTQIRVRTMTTLGAAPVAEALVVPGAEGSVKIRKPEAAQAFFQIGL